MGLRWLVALGLVVGCDNGSEPPGGDDGDGPTTSSGEEAGEDDDGETGEHDEGPATSEDTGTTSDDGGSSSGGEESSGSTGSTGSPTDAPTFVEVFQTVIAGRACNNGYCHGSGDGGLFLVDVDSSYEALVDAAANDGSCGHAMLVVPGDASASALWTRLDPNGSAPEGCSKMPLMDASLSEEDAALVLDWINGGARRG